MQRDTKDIWTENICTPIKFLQSEVVLDDLEFLIRHATPQPSKLKPNFKSFKSSIDTIRSFCIEKIKSLEKQEENSKNIRKNIRKRPPLDDSCPPQTLKAKSLLTRESRIKAGLSQLKTSIHSLDQISKETKCHKRDLRLMRTAEFLFPEFDPKDLWENISIDIEDEVLKLINDEQLRYTCSNDIRRHLLQRGIQVSQRKICSILRKNRFVWRESKSMNQKTKIIRKYEESDIRSCLNVLAKGLEEETYIIVFLDEMILPLDQTPQMMWQNSDNRQRKDLRTTKKKTIHSIVASTYEGFYAVQLYQSPIHAEDFAFFLTTLHQRLEKEYPTKVIIYYLDCASWHQAKNIQLLDLSNSLCFNLPGMFILNQIENFFSITRHNFRKRQLVRSFEDEVRLIVECFLKANESIKKSSFLRNHCRAILKVIDMYFVADRLKKGIKKEEYLSRQETRFKSGRNDIKT